LSTGSTWLLKPIAAPYGMIEPVSEPSPELPPASVGINDPSPPVTRSTATDPDGRPVSPSLNTE
jgi:hypothetical protein